MRTQTNGAVATDEREVADDARFETHGERRRSSRGLALALAGLAAVAAAIGAIGPSTPERSTYSWPPAAVSAAAPTTAWYTPLVLMRHRPAALRVGLPCNLSQPLPGAGTPSTVLATTRAMGRSGGLRVVGEEGRLSIWANGALLARVPLSPGGTRDCAYELSVADDAWLLSGGPASVQRTGRLDAMPIVTGLFSEIDVSQPHAPRVEMTTAAYASRPTRWQSIAWGLAALAAIASLLLVGAGRGATRQPRPMLSVRPLVRGARPADAVVLGTLVSWWIVAPVIWDDGWIVARGRAYSDSGGLTNFYDALGTNLPNDYWLEWLQHWVSSATNILLVWRLPALVSLGLLWLVCRWTLGHVLERRARSLELWALASAFLGCAIAWGMTLRPEPFTALLVTGVLACAVAFRRSPSGAPIAIAVVLVPLAVSAHHTGFTALAPLLAIAPTLARWARRHVSESVALITSATALLVVLTTVGADVAVRFADAKATSEFSGSGVASWHEEIERYQRFAVSVWATPPRRGSVALILLLAGFFLFRRARSRELLDVPGRSLLLALPLLIFTASKLPWHFGVLIGLTAVAAGAESSRLSREASRATALSARSLLFVTAMLVAGGWALAVRGYFNPIDLGTLEWRFAFEKASGVPLQVLTTLLPLAALFAVVLAGALRRRGGELYAAPWRVASAAAPILMVPLLALTFIVFAVDMARSTWTIRQHNVESLLGRSSCGIADHLEVALPDGQVTQLSRALRRPGATAYISPEIFPYFPCARQPRLSGGVTEPPDYVLMSYFHRPFIYRTSPFEGVLDLYPLERLRVVGPYAPKEFELFVVRKTIPGAVELPPTRRVVRST